VIKKIFGTFACLLLALGFSVLVMMADGFYAPQNEFMMGVLMIIIIFVSSLYIIDSVIFN